ncbi:MAG: response regulator [Acidobacteria bacterium]|nr:response regulator [Acidobacteriota bacterium]NIM60750.1 response regulator [Acidobacteriota bacterium]NIO57963.1 response regulator [Acidobacteriota bacterium]NIQ28968.1 response regulator [Acidobacteriota bacterium]NIQ83440.1 response regulator [Acidobacteriota bacterium]
MHVLIVEDEITLREGLVDLLTGDGHEVMVAADGEAGLEMGADPRVELVLLDLMLPKLDGISVCRQLREDRPGLPILVLTARGAEEEKVEGLKAGADDYVTKPFGSKELLARIEALGRRSTATPEPPQTIETDGCRIDIGRLVANRADRKINLTAREANILRLLHEHRNRGVSRAELLTEVWGASAEQQTRTVDMTIANLRQKIEADPSNPRIVVTVKGVGYAWGSE